MTSSSIPSTTTTERTTARRSDYFEGTNILKDNVKEIGTVIFGISSAEEILAMSVCKVNSTKLSGPGTVYDERMGCGADTVDNCITCDMSSRQCPGHFGHIELHEPILHPLYYKQIVAYLKCFCTKCSRLLINKNQLEISGLNKYKRGNRFKKLIERLDKINSCCHCGNPHPKITHSITDHTISMVYKEKVPSVKGVKKREIKTSIVLTVDDIKKIFDPILDRDVVLCGFDPTRVHPRNYVMTIFPVLPPCFTAGTMIHTKWGFTPIEKVEVGDLLFTHQNRYKPVKELFVTNYTGKLINVTTVCSGPRVIEATPEHPFYVMVDRSKEGGRGHGKWVKASNLTVNDYVGIALFPSNILPDTTKIEDFVKYKGAITKSMDQALQLQFILFCKKTVTVISRRGDKYIVKHICDHLHVIFSDRYMWIKIKDIESKDVSDTLVYNFEVSTDNSYTVDNIVVHNCARPFVMADGNICDDDLTNQLLEIIKANNTIEQENKNHDDNHHQPGIPVGSGNGGGRTAGVSSSSKSIFMDNKKFTPPGNLKKSELAQVRLKAERSEAKKQKAIQTVKFRISTFYNNSNGKATHPTNDRPIKGVKERITGKEGQMRNHNMGKRVDYSGRSVISPEPNLRFGEVGVPIEVAQQLTVPVRVTSFNIDHLTEIVNANQANVIVRKKGGIKINLKYAMMKRGTNLVYGDIIIRGDKKMTYINRNIVLIEGDKIMRNGIILPDIKYPLTKKITLYKGDEVHRHLIDDDIVLLNRQPTLHKGSIMAKKVKVMKWKTFRFNFDSCGSYNADFDGD